MFDHPVPIERIAATANPADVVISPSAPLNALRVDAALVSVRNLAVGLVVLVVQLRLADVAAPALKSVRIQVGENVSVLSALIFISVRHFDTTASVSISRVELHQFTIGTVAWVNVNFSLARRVVLHGSVKSETVQSNADQIGLFILCARHQAFIIIAIGMEMVMILVLVRVAHAKVHRRELIPNGIATVAVVRLVDGDAINGKTNDTGPCTLGDAFFLGQQNSGLWQTIAVVALLNQSVVCQSPCVVIGNRVEVVLLSDKAIVRRHLDR